MVSRLSKLSVVAALAATAALVLAATGTGTTSTSAKTRVNIAFFQVLPNTYGIAQLRGVREAAKAAGNVSVTVFAAGFDPQKQFSQCEDASTSKNYNGVIMTAVNGPTVIPCVKDAIKAGFKVAVPVAPRSAGSSRASGSARQSCCRGAARGRPRRS